MSSGGKLSFAHDGRVWVLNFDRMEVLHPDGKTETVRFRGILTLATGQGSETRTLGVKLEDRRWLDRIGHPVVVGFLGGTCAVLTALFLARTL